MAARAGQPRHRRRPGSRTDNTSSAPSLPMLQAMSQPPMPLRSRSIQPSPLARFRFSALPIPARLHPTSSPRIPPSISALRAARQGQPSSTRSRPMPAQAGRPRPRHNPALPMAPISTAPSLPMRPGIRLRPTALRSRSIQPSHPARFRLPALPIPEPRQAISSPGYRLRPQSCG